MHVKGGVVQGSLVSVHGGHAAEKRRHLCPLPPARQQSGCSPHTSLGQAACPPATPSQPGPRGRRGTKLPPPFCKQPTSQKKREEPTPQAVTALPGYPSGPGVQRKTPQVSPMHLSLLFLAPATPYSPHSMGATGWARAAENSSFTSIKNTIPLFPLDPISYLLTVVKYYCSAPPNRQVFLSAQATHHLFFKAEKHGDFSFLSVGVLFAALMLQSGE